MLLRAGIVSRSAGEKRGWHTCGGWCSRASQGACPPSMACTSWPPSTSARRHLCSLPRRGPWRPSRPALRPFPSLTSRSEGYCAAGSGPAQS
eukprot:365121-Rhodomonas_salina.2